MPVLRNATRACRPRPAARAGRGGPCSICRARGASPSIAPASLARAGAVRVDRVDAPLGPAVARGLRSARAAGPVCPDRRGSRRRLRDGGRDQPVLGDPDGQPLRVRPEVPAWRVLPVHPASGRGADQPHRAPGRHVSWCRRVAASGVRGRRRRAGPNGGAGGASLQRGADADRARCKMCSASSSGLPAIPRCSRWSTSHASSASAHDRSSACSEPMWGPARNG